MLIPAEAAATYCRTDQALKLIELLVRVDDERRAPAPYYQVLAEIKHHLGQRH